MKKKANLKKSIITAVIFVGLLAGIDLSSSDIKMLDGLIDLLQTDLNNRDEIYEKAEVVRIVDGDTIVVELGGEEEKVRFIGVDTPESVGRYSNNPEKYSEEASEFTKAVLEGLIVYLEKDEDERDSYGRLLRYVWLEQPKYSDIESTLFNAILLEKGYASAMTILPNDKYSEVFINLESRARETEIGIWE